MRDDPGILAPRTRVFPDGAAGRGGAGWTHDHDTTRGLDTIAFALAPGAPTWRTNIADRWFNSGPGQALALLNTSTSTHNSPTESPATTAVHRPRTLTA